eukprot:130536-Chlamydomonas_euryale.AAC.6
MTSKSANAACTSKAGQHECKHSGRAAHAVRPGGHRSRAGWRTQSGRAAHAVRPGGACSRAGRRRRRLHRGECKPPSVWMSSGVGFGSELLTRVWI